MAMDYRLDPAPSRLTSVTSLYPLHAVPAERAANQVGGHGVENIFIYSKAGFCGPVSTNDITIRRSQGDGCTQVFLRFLIQSLYLLRAWLS